MSAVFLDLEVLSDLRAIDRLKAERASLGFRAVRAFNVLEIIILHSSLSDLGLARALTELQTLAEFIDATNYPVPR